MNDLTPSSLNGANSMGTQAAESTPSIAYDKVSLEDVLAARVIRKSLAGIGFVLALVAASLAATWFDLYNQRQQVADQRKALADAREGLTRQLDSLRRSVLTIKDSLRFELNEAAGSVQHAAEYEATMGRQLVEFGRLMGTATDAGKRADSAAVQAHNAAQSVNEMRKEYAKRITDDSATLSVFRASLSGSVDSAFQGAMTARYLVLNRWGQLVEEEKRTPISDSRFWVRFDDVHGNILTHTKVWFDDGRGQVHVNQVPSSLRVGDSIFVKVGGSQYLIVAQSRYSQRTTLLHQDRAVFFVERVSPKSPLGEVKTAGLER